MNEQLLRAFIREKLLLQEASLENKHFPGYAEDKGQRQSGNLVVQKAAGGEDGSGPKSLDKFYVQKKGALLRFQGNNGEWTAKQLRKNGKLTLHTTHWDDVGKPTGMPGNATNYIEVTDSTGKRGWIARNKVGHSITSKASEGILADSKIGKMAEHALKMAINTPDAIPSDTEVNQALAAAKLERNFQAASPKDRQKFRGMFEIIHAAAKKAIAGANKISLSSAVVPPGQTALVDVTATVEGDTGIVRNAEIHVKYNDSTRKFGLQPGKRLKNNQSKQEILVKSENADGNVQVQVQTTAGAGDDAVTTLGPLEAGNPSTLIWKAAREEMWNEYIPADIREKVIQGNHSQFKDTDFIQVSTVNPLSVAWKDSLRDSNPRSEFLDKLAEWRYPQALAEDITKNFKNEAEGGFVTMYALFTSTGTDPATATVSLDFEAYDLKTDETPLAAVRRDDDNSKLFMYDINSGEDNIFKIEFREAGRGAGHPPQVKKGDVGLDGFLVPVADVEVEATEADTTMENIMNKKILITRRELETLISESLLLEDLTGTDKSEIKRMIKKEIEGTINKKMIDKSFKKNFDKELKKALGVSFFGTPGKINKFVVDEIHDEVEKILGTGATRELVVQICKDVIIKLYRELSFSYQPVIRRLKV